VGLMINKEANNSSTWNNTIIPLWIVIVMSLVILLMLFILFLNVVGLLLKKVFDGDVPTFSLSFPEWNLFLLAFWLLANWTGLTVTGVLFLTKFAKILENHEDLEDSFSLIMFPTIHWTVIGLFTIFFRRLI
jgi:hypothetical protein